MPTRGVSSNLLPSSWSVTKWVHLNWGDDGIRKLFAKVYAMLKPGGQFILEPQAYSSYCRRSRLTPVRSRPAISHAQGRTRLTSRCSF